MRRIFIVILCLLINIPCLADYTPELGDNIIINPAMDIAQRGTSFVAITGGSYSLDRWIYMNVTTAVHTITRDTDVPTLAQARTKLLYSYKVDCTTADAAVAAGDRLEIGQRIEGYNIRNIMGKTITLSFWVKATKTGIYCVSLRNGAVDLSYVAEYTVNAANTWERKVITLTMADGSSGTWYYSVSIGLYLYWSLMCGNTYQTTAGNWQAGSFTGTANQVNAVDSTDNNFWLTAVKLELGNISTQFYPRDIGTELRLCERYYEIYKADGTGNFLPGVFYGLAAGAYGQWISYRTYKKGHPDIDINGTWTVSNCSQPVVGSNYITQDGFWLYTTVTANGRYFFLTDSADDTVTINAEL